MRRIGGIRQLGHVVADLDVELERWRRQRGIGPWTVMRNICLNSRYRGQPSKPLIDIALAYCGDVQIELIQQRNDAHRRASRDDLRHPHRHARLCEMESVDTAVPGR